MGDNRNFLIAVALSLLVFVGWQHFFVTPKMQAEKARQEAAAQHTASPQANGQQAANAPAAPAGATVNLPSVTGTQSSTAPAAPATGNTAQTSVGTTLGRDQALAASPRIEVDTPRVDGSISLKGARFDDLHLRNFHETVDKTSPEITLLSPAGVTQPYFAEFGWIAGPGSNVTLPTHETMWQAQEDAKLTPATPVTLTYDNGQGLVFKREVSVDQHFLFTVKDTVANNSGTAVTLYPYGLISRTGKPKGQSFFILHEGFIGEFKDVGEKALKYEKALEEAPENIPAKEGWLGITDKYWATAIVPDAKHGFVGRYSADAAASGHAEDARYQADFRYEALTIAPGATSEVSNRLFAGAKVVRVIDSYKDQGIYRFNLLIDWGWFWFLTQPMFKGLDLIAQQVGNFGIAILIITVIIKLFFFPLANRAYAAMGKMKKLQPEMEKLRDRYKDDRLKQQQEIMELYKREKVNPVAGCLPILVQIPVFFALYKVLFVTIEMRHAPFFGWIHDLSAPDPTTIFNLFGLIPWAPPSFLMIGLWPLIMGFTMYVQQQMNPAPSDPIQQKIFAWMPVIFTFMLAGFPAGLVIYWAWNNLLSVLQQGVIMKKQGVKIELFSNTGLEKLFKRNPDKS